VNAVVEETTYSVGEVVWLVVHITCDLGGSCLTLASSCRVCLVARRVEVRATFNKRGSD